MVLTTVGYGARAPHTFAGQVQQVLMIYLMSVLYKWNWDSCYLSLLYTFRVLKMQLWTLSFRRNFSNAHFFGVVQKLVYFLCKCMLTITRKINWISQFWEMNIYKKKKMQQATYISTVIWFDSFLLDYWWLLCTDWSFYSGFASSNSSEQVRMMGDCLIQN